MIRIIKEDDIDVASKYMWHVYQDDEKRTTPPYHSLNDIENSLLKTLKCEGDDILGVYVEGKLEGIALVLVVESNKYLSLQGPYIKNSSLYKKLATEFMDYLEVNYKGYECNFGTTKTNILSQEFLISKGFSCTDDTVQMSITPDKLKKVEIKSEIQLLSEYQMHEYKVFHDREFHDYYWLFDRIKEDMSQWKIHVLLDSDKIVGSVFTRARPGGSGEVFGCKVIDAYKNKQVMTELYYTSTKSWLNEDVKEIVNFLPEGLESESAAEVGYEGYDTYMCFYKAKI